MLEWLTNFIVYQIINVTSTTPCFLNYSAGVQMWRNCGLDVDYLKTALLPWEWITGGNFSMVLASVLILGTWLKYHKAVYPIMIGLIMFPISYFVFPEQFITFALLLVGIEAGILMWWIKTSQTNET